MIDSENVCVGEKILVQYALRLVEEGKSAKEIADALEIAKKKVCLVALLDTLEYLRKGGRISNVTGIVGGMLSIKPVIGIVDGVVGMRRGADDVDIASQTRLAQEFASELFIQET